MFRIHYASSRVRCYYRGNKKKRPRTSALIYICLGFCGGFRARAGCDARPGHQRDLPRAPCCKRAVVSDAVIQTDRPSPSVTLTDCTHSRGEKRAWLFHSRLLRPDLLSPLEPSASAEAAPTPVSACAASLLITRLLKLACVCLGAQQTNSE